MEKLCVNSNKSDILNLSATHYIPYESSISQVSEDYDSYTVMLRRNPSLAYRL